MKPDFSLGYERDGEHFGLGVSLKTPPESFSVRKHDCETGDYEESFYTPEKTCTNLRAGTSSLIKHCYSVRLFECSSCLEISLHDDVETFQYCPYCGAKVVDE